MQPSAPITASSLRSNKPTGGCRSDHAEEREQRRRRLPRRPRAAATRPGSSRLAGVLSLKPTDMYTATDNSRPQRSDTVPYRMAGIASAQGVAINAMQVAGWLLHGWRWILVGLAGDCPASRDNSCCPGSPRSPTTIRRPLQVTPTISTRPISRATARSWMSEPCGRSRPEMSCAVIDKLGLANDPDLLTDAFDRSQLAVDRNASDAARRNDLIGLLAKRINVVRQGAPMSSLSVGRASRRWRQLANSIATTFRGRSFVLTQSERVAWPRGWQHGSASSRRQRPRRKTAPKRSGAPMTAAKAVQAAAEHRHTWSG